MDQRKHCCQSSHWRPCYSCYCEQKDRTSALEHCQYVVIPRSRARLTQGHRGRCWVCFSFWHDDTVEHPSSVQPLILSYIVCAVISTINYLIEFEWALTVLSGGETSKQPAWVETVAQNSYPGSIFVISFSAGIYWNDGSNIVVHVHLWAGLLIPHWIEHKIKMATCEWGLLKKNVADKSAVDVATGPGPVRWCISPRPQNELHPRVSHFACQRSTWWHHFCGELSVQPPFLSPPLSGSL